MTICAITGEFRPDYDPTIEDNYRGSFVTDGVACYIDVLDTHHQEDCNSRLEQWLRYCQGVIIVYSITSRYSFDDVIRFRKQIVRFKADYEQDIPMYVVFNPYRYY